MGQRDYMRGGFDGERPSFWSTDAGTKAVLIGLASIHLLMALLRSAAPDVHGGIEVYLYLWPGAALKQFRVWQLATYALFHAPGFWHLAGNCIGIYFLGRMVEQRMGLKRYLLFCLGAAVSGGLLYLLESALLQNKHPMLGASAFAMGLMILAALWYPRVTILFMFFLPMPLWLLAVILVFLDLLGALQMAGGIAHTAHLGGVAYALIYYRYGGGFERIFGRIDRFADQQKVKKQQKLRRREEELRKEVDRILDKVNREGMAALSEEEKRFLKEASEKLRR